MARSELVYFTNEDAALEAKAIQLADDDPGYLEGYAAVYENLDLQNEIIARGCFSDSVKAEVPSGSVKLMVRHFRDGGDVSDCIGTVRRAADHPYGLWIHGVFSRVQLAQDTRVKVLEGHVRGLSVGFTPQTWELRSVGGRRVRVHTKGKLAEVTVTVRSANPKAQISSAKNDGFEGVKRAFGLKVARCWLRLKRLQNGL
jgi:HK97 family phage prohead protease